MESLDAVLKFATMPSDDQKESSPTAPLQLTTAAFSRPIAPKARKKKCFVCKSGKYVRCSVYSNITEEALISNRASWQPWYCCVFNSMPFKKTILQRKLLFPIVHHGNRGFAMDCIVQHVYEQRKRLLSVLLQYIIYICIYVVL